MDVYSSDLGIYIVVTDLRHVKFWVTLTPFFQGHSLICRISLEPMGGFSANVLRYTHVFVNT